MALRINDTAPDFTAATTQGEIGFHDWMGDGWAMLFSHPTDFTPVCATELGNVAQLNDDFAKRNCKVMGLSVDRVEDLLDADNGAGRQDFELDLATGQLLDVIGEVLKHHHFVGGVGDHRLDPDLCRSFGRHAKQRRCRQQCGSGRTPGKSG